MAARFVPSSLRTARLQLILLIVATALVVMVSFQTWPQSFQYANEYASALLSASTACREDDIRSAAGATTELRADRPLAVVLENAMTDNLVPLMLHFASVLGPTWTVVLFTLEAGWELPASQAFRRAIDSRQIEIRFLPETTFLRSSISVSNFLTSPWIWEQVESAQRVLLFQTDSIICSKSEYPVESYFGWDYIGAPIDELHGVGFNGGLSLRNPRMFLEITRTADFATSGEGYEDQFFYKQVRAMGGALPSEDVAKTFSVETIYHTQPLGYHQAQRWWQGERMKEIEEWCPEVKMILGRRAT